MASTNTSLQKKELKYPKHYNNLSDAFIDRYADFMKNPAPQQEQFARDMINLILNDVDTNTVTTIPARCGISKSIFAQSLISFFTRYNNYDPRNRDSLGLIIVTDMLTRLKDYQKPPEYIDSVWGSELYEKICHDRFCTYISSDNNKKTALKLLIDSRYKPIVLLSTQRYFTMPDDQRELLFEYQYGKGNNKKIFKREIVIFDEKPDFYNCKKITVKDFNLCAAALQEGISKSDVNKDKILQEFRAFRNKMEFILREKEKAKISKPTDRFYWRDMSTQSITSLGLLNDDEFFGKVEKHRKTITKKYPDTFTNLKAFKQLMQEGAFFITVSRKNSEGQDYETYFYLYQNNKDKFYIGENKAKFFVFDATADIDPDYDLDYINMVDCSQYNIDINMKINHTNVNTSKSQIVNGKHKENIISSINKILRGKIKTGFGSIFAVTYKDIKDSFEDRHINTAHFGGIKGLNSFANSLRMAHIGLNRQSDFDYFMTLISAQPEILDMLKQMDESKSREFINDSIALSKGLFVSDELNDIMNRSLLSDFEQNIFRTKIRNYQNKEQVEIFTYWNCDMFSDLNSLIYKRYSPYGVKFEYMGVPLEIEKAKTENWKPKDGELTDAQKIIKWHTTQEKGTVVKRSKLLDELGVSTNNFKRLMKDNRTVISLLKTGSKQGYYEVV